MAEYKIERKKLNIEIYGVKYELTKPKFNQIIEYQEKLQSLNNLEKFQAVKQNLMDCGLPEEVINDLDHDSMIELIEIINGSKKN